MRRRASGLQTPGLRNSFNGYLNDPTPLPIRRTADLLIGRQSIPGATYFVTLCETNRHPALLDPPVALEIRNSLDRLHASDDFTLIAATVMPDHVHLLGVLGPRLSISRLIGKFKADTHRVLRPRGLEWQENFYEHRLRDGNETEPFARYIFLNPYRAKLIGLSKKWPLWRRWGDVRFAFEAMVAQTNSVPSAWIDESDPAGAADL